MDIMQSPPRTPIGQVHVCLYQLVCFPQVVNTQKLKRYLNRGKNEHDHKHKLALFNHNHRLLEPAVFAVRPHERARIVDQLLVVLDVRVEKVQLLILLHRGDVEALHAGFLGRQPSNAWLTGCCCSAVAVAVLLTRPAGGGSP